MAKPGDCPFDPLSLGPLVVRYPGKDWWRAILLDAQGCRQAQVFGRTEQQAMNRAAWLMDMIDESKPSGPSPSRLEAAPKDRMEKGK